MSLGVSFGGFVVSWRALGRISVGLLGAALQKVMTRAKHVEGTTAGAISAQLALVRCSNFTPCSLFKVAQRHTPEKGMGQWRINRLPQPPNDISQRQAHKHACKTSTRSLYEIFTRSPYQAGPAAQDPAKA